MRAWLPELLCGAVLCVILSLGLWPFHVPRNDVTWLPGRDGLHFGRYSTVLSASEFPLQVEQTSPSASLEVWLQPGRIWDFSTILAFYSPNDLARLSLRQWQLDLRLHAAQDLQVENVFPRQGWVFLTVTSGSQGTTVYVNGIPVRKAPAFRLTARAFTGRLVLGDAPRQSDSWRGQLFGLALYHTELDASEVHSHFLAWTGRQAPSLLSSNDVSALYLFGEHSGSVTHSSTGAGPDLLIPKNYTVLDQVVLETPWSEFRRTQGFWGAVVKNIVGFLPFGFCFCAYFTLVRQTRHPMLVTVLIGTATSLTIEILQAFLPMRDSGMMDIVTNTLGTFLGALAYVSVHPAAVSILKDALKELSNP